MKSLDQIDKEIFNPNLSPLEGIPLQVILQPNTVEHSKGTPSLDLNGEWQLAMDGNASERLGIAWSDSITAEVPGSIHTALLKSGLIPDPYVGKNDEIARSFSFKTWWYKRIFTKPEGFKHARLLFGGVCDMCTVWLNGTELGNHKGMFGGPDFEISQLLKEGENVLIVKLEPAPYKERTTEINEYFNGMNVGWLNSVVFNNVYGWHYINLPALGIWRSVVIEEVPTVQLANPFIATIHAEEGCVRLQALLVNREQPIPGKLQVSIEPDNFSGDSYHFIHTLEATESKVPLFEFTIPNPQLWWPNGYGEQALYKLKLSFVPGNGENPHYKESLFGIRTIEMKPLHEGPKPELYNWTFVINGKPMFIKGTNWCTMDALMRFEYERYDRFLSMAQESHTQLLRAWGSGMPETDEFYELADRKGIMVIQEWPTAWDSDLVQPTDVLNETVIHNTLRLRNHPSLIMWGGGNESANPTGPVIDMFGRLSYELDGTRPFHRGEPWGGSIHNYEVYWERKPLDRNLSLTGLFIGEFGLASLPDMETVRRYIPAEEQVIWPAPEQGSFVHHTPVFNLKECMLNLAEYVPDFLANDSMEAFVLGTQLAQATGIRYTLELARTRWPDCTGVAYYKMNDNNPAASWSTVDWYGAPKLAYYIIKDAYAPLHIAVLLDTLNPGAKAIDLPVYLLDDTDKLKDTQWSVIVRAVDNQLTEVKRESYDGDGAVATVTLLGQFDLTAEQADSKPLFIVTDIIVNGELVHRSFSWLNYQLKQGSLFELPQTNLELSVENDLCIVTNRGHLPAVAVHLAVKDQMHEFKPDDNYFWLEPGETRHVKTNIAAGVEVSAWNVTRPTY